MICVFYIQKLVYSRIFIVKKLNYKNPWFDVIFDKNWERYFLRFSLNASINFFHFITFSYHYKSVSCTMCLNFTKSLGISYFPQCQFYTFGTPWSLSLNSWCRWWRKVTITKISRHKETEEKTWIRYNFIVVMDSKLFFCYCMKSSVKPLHKVHELKQEKYNIKRGR